MRSAKQDRGTLAQAAQQEAAFGTLPLLPHERVWGFGSFTAISTGLAIATWAFLAGGFTALFVGGKEGLAAILIGNLVGVSLVVLAPSAKYGLEQYTLLRSVFGRIGVRVVVLGLVLIIEMGWSSVLAIMFGRATTNVANQAFGTSIDPNGLTVSLLAALAILVSWVVLAKGPVSIKWFNNIVAPVLAIVVVGMAILLMTQYSWSTIMGAPALAPLEDSTTSFLLALELNVAAGLSWWPVMGNLARMTTSQRVALWPSVIGMFGATVAAAIVGLFAALVLGDSDPTVWMIPLGGTTLGVLALIFIAFANITSIVSIIYSTCLALRQAGGRAIERLRWEYLTAAFFLLPLFAAFFPGAIYDNFFVFVAWNAVAFAPLTGIGLVDYFLLRRRRLEVRAIYDERPGAPFFFWKGVNVTAFIALAAGITVYLLLMNPQTFETTPLFGSMTASLPSLLASAVVYYVLARAVLVRTGMGGYPSGAGAAGEVPSQQAGPLG
jgi:NCS1 family nucleobase:cation symporter-1